MPPKRAAKRASANDSSTSKRSKIDGESGPSPALPNKNKRWAAVSASANAEADYRLATGNPVHAYSYICICRPPFEREDDEDEWEDEQSDDEDNPQESSDRCDGGQSCLCNKPAADHPEHPWLITYAGWRKFYTQHIHASLRCPDNFDMYTYNDHAGYGMLEVVQNLLLDYVESDSNWKEQW